MKLRYKILLGFSIILLILIGISVYNLLFLQSTNAVITEIVDKRFRTDKIIQDSETIVMQIHSDIWDALLFGEGARELRTQEMQDDAKQFYAHIRNLQEIIPENKDTFEIIKQNFQYYVQFGSSILEFRDLNEFNENMGIVNKFKENKLNVIEKMEAVGGSSSSEFSTALEALRSKFQFTSILMMIITLIAVLTGIIAALAISGTLIKPIHSLVNVMKEVEMDNYDIRSKNRSNDEIGQLSRTFNSMTDQIQASRDQLKDKARLTKEMEIAEHIQTSLCPHVPIYDELEMAASMTPAEEVGGDYYDMIIDKNENLWIAIGDVSGHGVTPGLIMMMAETAFNSFVLEMGQVATPKDAIISVNKTLTDNIRDRLHEKHFMTMNFLKYTGSGKFLHSGAHVDIIVYRSKTKKCDIYPTDGIYLGIIPDITAHTQDKTFELNDNDILVVYTDGVIESKHKDNGDNLLGIHALQDTIIAHGEKSATSIMEAIRTRAMDWCGHKPDDDITVVVIKKIK